MHSINARVEDREFDAVTIAVSVDYLNKPLEVFKEMHRVLKPVPLNAVVNLQVQLWIDLFSRC